MALIIDIVYYNVYPDISESVGYGLVLISLVGMALADEIQGLICPNQTSSYKVEQK